MQTLCLLFLLVMVTGSGSKSSATPMPVADTVPSTAATRPSADEHDVEETSQVVQHENIVIRLIADRVKVQVAQPIELRLEVDAPGNTQVTMPEVGDSLGNLQVTDRRQFDAVPIDSESGNRRWTLRLTVESLDSGPITVPPIPIRYRIPSTTAGGLSKREGQAQREAQAEPDAASDQTLLTQPLEIEVVSLLSEEQDLKAFRAIKGAVASPEPEVKKTRAPTILLASVAVLALLTSAVLWIRRRPQPSPVQWALGELEAIEARDPAVVASPAETHVALSGLLRIFLERQLGFPATSQSTPELGQSLTERFLPDSTVAQVTRFLAEADEIKFSGRTPSGSAHHDGSTSLVREIINEVAEQARSTPQTPQQGE